MGSGKRESGTGSSKEKELVWKKEVDKQKRFKYKGGPLRDQREAKAGLKKEEKRS
jgi:hypothetical protein